MIAEVREQIRQARNDRARLWLADQRPIRLTHCERCDAPLSGQSRRFCSGDCRKRWHERRGGMHL